jgi:histidyl-tRNA synthetase
LNHRQLLTSILNLCEIPEALHGTALVAVDKLDKIGADGVKAEMESRGIGGDSAARLLSTFDVLRDGQGSRSVLVDEAGQAAFANLAEIVALTEGTGAAPHMRFDPSLARGLSYYTGAIMEIAVPDLAGSLGGGGRYDNLVGMFLGQDVPACGFSLGLERILVVMSERNMFPPALTRSVADVMVAVFDPADMAAAIGLAGRLRSAGLRVLLYPDADKIGKQIKYADSRGVPFVALLGANEITAGTVTVKDLKAQTQNTYDQTAAGAQIRQALEGLKDRG